MQPKILIDQISASETFDDPTISAGLLTLNLANANIFDVALNANVTTLSITNVPTPVDTAVGFTLVFTADGTLRTVTWPASILWPGGTAPTLTSTNGKRDMFVFFSLDNGTTWLAVVAGQNF